MKLSLRPMLLMMTVISLFSCYTEQKAQKQLNKAYDRHLNVVAKFVHKEFPCEERPAEVIHDTSYDFIEIACQDYKNDTIYKVDTVLLPVHFKPKIIEVYKNKIIKIPSEKIYVTKIVKDSAEMTILHTKINQLQKDKDELNIKLEKKNEWIKWLLIVLAGLLLITVSIGWATMIDKK